MEILIDKKQFASYSDMVIGQFCFEQLLSQYQASLQGLSYKELDEVKIQFYSTLTTGQYKLFIFYVFYNHAIRSLDDFYGISLFFIESSTFEEIKRCMKYFNNRTMYQVLLEVEKLLVEPDADQCVNILEDRRIKQYTRFKRLAPKALERIGKRIRRDIATYFILI